MPECNNFFFKPYVLHPSDLHKFNDNYIIIERYDMKEKETLHTPFN